MSYLFVGDIVFGYLFIIVQYGVVYFIESMILKASYGVLIDNVVNGGYEIYWQFYGIWGNYFGGIVYVEKFIFIDNC